MEEEKIPLHHHIKRHVRKHKRKYIRFIFFTLFLIAFAVIEDATVAVAIGTSLNPLTLSYIVILSTLFTAFAELTETIVKQEKKPAEELERRLSKDERKIIKRIRKEI